VKSIGTIDYIDILKIYYFNESFTKATELLKMAFEVYLVSPTEFGMYEYMLMRSNMLQEANRFYKTTIKNNKESIQDASNDTEIDEDNKNALIKTLSIEVQQYDFLYNQIKNGDKPLIVFEPQIEEECYLFGCPHHESQDS